MDEASGDSSRTLLRSLASKRMMVILLLGFSSGLPYMLMHVSMKIWLRNEGFDLRTIGYVSWVTLPYSLNFLWSPLLDRYIPFSMGRRRSWILLTQLALVVGFMGLGFVQPAVSLASVVGMAVAVSFFSATQDIAIDAYRRESLPDQEQGFGASVVVYGYRIAIVVATGLGLWLVDPTTLGLSFNQMFQLMALFMGIGLATTLWCTEPEREFTLPQGFRQTVIEPFVEFLERDGAKLILLFVLCFKAGDAFAAAVTPAYYVDLGYSNSQIAEAAKGVGFFSTLLGLFLGGLLIYRLGVVKSLLLFASLQAVSTALFVLLQWANGSWWALAGIVALEDLSSGMGTAALVAFMSLLANKRYTATQYALLSSLASFGRTFLSGFSGELAEGVGYTGFYLSASAMAIPGILLLLKVRTYYNGATA